MNGGTEYFESPGAKGTLRGMIHHGTLGPWALIAHGYFSSNKIGPYRLYVELAEALRHRGVTVVRVDLSGMGESDGRIEEVRYVDHVKDFETVQHHLGDTYSVSRLHIIAHCAGCHVALSAAPSGATGSLTLIAPFIAGEQGFQRRMFSAAEWQELQEKGSTLRKGRYCHKSFFDSSSVLSRPFDALLRSRTRAIFAGADEMTPLADSVTWAKKQAVPYSIVSAADHNITSPAARDDLVECVAHSILDVA